MNSITAGMYHRRRAHEALEPPCVLHERALPGHGQGQEQRVEARVVEALTHVAAGGQDEALLIRRNRGELVPGRVVSLLPHSQP